MDLNVQPPAKWTLDGPYEIAEHCINTATDTLILLNAWLFSGHEDVDERFGVGQRDFGTLNYWATRLRPLWESGGVWKNASGDGKETKVIICNRCGEENGEHIHIGSFLRPVWNDVFTGKNFAGSSAAFSMIRGSDRPVLVHSLSRRDQEVGLWEV